MPQLRWNRMSSRFKIAWENGSSTALTAGTVTAGVQHRGLGQQHAACINKAERDVEPERKADFLIFRPRYDVFVLVKEEEGDDERHKQQAQGLEPIGAGVGDQHAEQPVGDEPRQQNADGHREQIGEKYISVLQLFAFTCHEEGEVLSNSYLLILP